MGRKTKTSLPKAKVKAKKSVSETGHFKNLVNMKILYQECLGLGINYDPSNAALTLSALANLITIAQTTMKNVSESKVLADNATNAKTIAAKPLKQLATRVFNTLVASGPSTYTIDDAKGLLNKIRGKRVSPLNPTEPVNPGDKIIKNISTSQQSLDRIIDNFTALIILAGAQPTYKPNETALKISTLNTLVNNITTLSHDVTTLNIKLQRDRFTRNDKLYANTTGVVDVSKAIKKYVKSVFLPTSPEFKNISKLKFVKLVK
jgi:hypothetical protein